MNDKIEIHSYATRKRQFGRRVSQIFSAGNQEFLTRRETFETIIDTALYMGVFQSLSAYEADDPWLSIMLREMCQVVLLPVHKMTEKERRELCALPDNESRKWWYVAYGFTESEAMSMVKGSTIVEACQEYGGCWTAGVVPFPQAISARHAVKLYMFNFGVAPERVSCIGEDACVRG